MKNNTDTHRRAQVLIVVLATIMPLLIAILAMSSDMGHIVVERANMQNCADAASLAAGQVLLEHQAAGSSEETGRAAALAEAEKLAADNGMTGCRLVVEFGTYENGTFAAADAQTTAMAVRCSMYRDDDAPEGRVKLHFSPMLGKQHAEVTTQAVCTIEDQINAVYEDLTPFAIPVGHVGEVGDYLTFYPAEDGGKGNSGGQTAAGNWGLLDFDGGANSNVDVGQWIRHGYDGGLVLSDDFETWIYGTPGFRASNEDDVLWRMANEPQCLMVIYDKVVDSGANTQYRVVGFLVATIVEANLKGNPKNKKLVCRIDNLKNFANVGTGSGGIDVNIRKVQLVR